MAERETATMDLTRREIETGTPEKFSATTVAYRIEGKSLVLLPVNCRSPYNKILNFRNLADTYNPDVVMGTESWLREEICNTEIFRADFTTFRRDRRGRSRGAFICAKNFIA
jgi:hypothetical protein